MRTAPAGSGPVNEPWRVLAARTVSRLTCFADRRRKAPHKPKSSPITACMVRDYRLAKCPQWVESRPKPLMVCNGWKADVTLISMIIEL